MNNKNIIVVVNGEDYVIDTYKEDVVLKALDSFVKRKTPLKLIVKYDDENPFASFIKNVLEAIKPSSREELENLDQMELSLDVLISLLSLVPDMKIITPEKEYDLLIDTFNFKLINYKKHYRYKWGLYLDNKRITYVPLKTIKKLKDKNKNELYFIMFIKNVKTTEK